MTIEKRKIYVFIVSLVLFSGSNIGGFPGIGITIKFLSNLILLLISLNILWWIFRNRKIPKLSFITYIYVLYICVCVVLSILNGNNEIQDELIALIKSMFGLVWLDQQIQTDNEYLTGPIMYSLIFWCILDSLLTFIYPSGVPFLYGGFILGWKNNKLVHLFASNLLLAFKYLKLKKCGANVLGYWILWLIYIVACIANATIVESSTTTVVILLMFIYLFVSKVLEKTFLTNGYFVFIFHALCFILLIFVREIFQEPLNELMQVLFDKDATFTGRIYIWRAALLLIAKSPIWGYGKYVPQSAIFPHGGIFIWEMAHNQILECLMEGGIVLALLWGGMVCRVLILNQKSGNEVSKLAIFSMFSFLFFFQTEASLSVISFFVFYIFYIMSKYDERALCEQPH